MIFLDSCPLVVGNRSVYFLQFQTFNGERSKFHLHTVYTMLSDRYYPIAGSRVRVSEEQSWMHVSCIIGTFLVKTVSISFPCSFTVVVAYLYWSL